MTVPARMGNIRCSFTVEVTPNDTVEKNGARARVESPGTVILMGSFALENLPTVRKETGTDSLGKVLIVAVDVGTEKHEKPHRTL